MDVRTLKAISIPIIFIVNFISGFLPYFLITRNMRLSDARKPDPNISSSSSQISPLSQKMKRYLTLANFFSAGVFLSTCFIGLYPGVSSKFNSIVRNHTSNAHPYPYAGLTLVMGFFLVWLVEILVHACIHSHQHHSHQTHSSTHSSDPGHPKSHNSTIITTDNNNSNKSSLMLTSVNCSQPSMEEKLLSNDEEEQNRATRTDSVDHEPHSHVPITGNLLGSVMLTFALGSHSIIEGLGFGVMDDMSAAVSMLLTVLLHEAVCAVSLGVNVASRRTALRPAAVLVAIFSALIPVGVGIGLIVDSGLQKNMAGDVTIAILQGVAAGTFVYVVFMEILPREMSHRRDALLRLVVMALGFSVIAAMQMAHGHGDFVAPSSSTNLSHETRGHTH